MENIWKAFSTSSARQCCSFPLKANTATAFARIVSAGTQFSDLRSIIMFTRPQLQSRAQFTSVGSDQQFKSKDVEQLVSYIRNHRHITDILFTGGDPMVMRAHQLARYIDAILADPGCAHLATIRIGSKSLA